MSPIPASKVAPAQFKLKTIHVVLSVAIAIIVIAGYASTYFGKNAVKEFQVDENTSKIRIYDAKLDEIDKRMDKVENSLSRIEESLKYIVERLKVKTLADNHRSSAIR